MYVFEWMYSVQGSDLGILGERTYPLAFEIC